jgi:secondary thiamine-phosphate synthase enzyme
MNIQTKGNCDLVDITSKAAQEVKKSPVNNGIATIFVTGSTAGVTTIENESGLLSDFKEMWDRNVPTNITYNHDRAWGDGNGHSHVRASLLGPSLTIPFTDKKLALGTWQQIIVADFDNRSRSRNLVLQIIGE